MSDSNDKNACQRVIFCLRKANFVSKWAEFSVDFRHWKLFEPFLVFLGENAVGRQIPGHTTASPSPFEVFGHVLQQSQKWLIACRRTQPWPWPLNLPSLQILSRTANPFKFYFIRLWTDGRTDGQMDRPSYRDAGTHLKMVLWHARFFI